MDLNNTSTMYMEPKAVNIYMEKSFINKILKRTVDIIAALIGTITLIPICLIVKMISVISGDKDTIFFTQDRIGKNGKIFKMYKFRTMVVDADNELKRILENNEDIRKEYKKNKKLKDDPRITKIGTFLRKTSIDEFPQFINILKGEMTLVGPRPYLEREKEDMMEYYYKIIMVKPGATGLWQVSGRSDLSFQERMDLDVLYVQNNSFIGDIIIIFRTIGAIFNKKGAI